MQYFFINKTSGIRPGTPARSRISAVLAFTLLLAHNSPAWALRPGQKQEQPAAGLEELKARLLEGVRDRVSGIVDRGSKRPERITLPDSRTTALSAAGLEEWEEAAEAEEAAEVEEAEEEVEEEQPAQRMVSLRSMIAGPDEFIQGVASSVHSIENRREREGKRPIYSVSTTDLTQALAAVSAGTADLLLISMSLRQESPVGLARSIDDIPLATNVVQLVDRGQQDRTENGNSPVPIYLIKDPSAVVPEAWKASLAQFQKKGWIQGIILAGELQSPEAFDALLEQAIPQIDLARRDSSQPPQASTDQSQTLPTKPETAPRTIGEEPSTKDTENLAATIEPKRNKRWQMTHRKIAHLLEEYNGEYLTRKALVDLSGMGPRTLDQHRWRSLVEAENERRRREGRKLIETSQSAETHLRRADPDRTDDRAGLEEVSPEVLAEIQAKYGNAPYAVGVRFGGNNISAGLVNLSGEVETRTAPPSDPVEAVAEGVRAVGTGSHPGH